MAPFHRDHSLRPTAPGLKGGGFVLNAWVVGGGRAAMAMSSGALVSEINQPFWELRAQGLCPPLHRLVGAQKTGCSKTEDFL